MDTEVETLPSKSTRQEGYVEAKHCLCIELLPDVNERATRIFSRLALRNKSKETAQRICHWGVV